MNRQTFMNELSRHLTGISEDEKQDILFDYDEHFRIGIEGGRIEEEIAAALGDPRTIAKQLRANHMIEKVQTIKSPGNMFRAVLATMGLGFFNLVFVSGLFIGVIAILISIFVASFSFVVGGVGVAIGTFLAPIYPQFIHSTMHPVTSLSFGVALAGLGILTFIGGVYSSKCFYRFTVKYLKCNIKIIKGDRSYER